MDAAVKNKISHRSAALAKLREYFKNHPEALQQVWTHCLVALLVRVSRVRHVNSRDLLVDRVPCELRSSCRMRTTRSRRTSASGTRDTQCSVVVAGALVPC